MLVTDVGDDLGYLDHQHPNLFTLASGTNIQKISKDVT